MRPTTRRLRGSAAAATVLLAAGLLVGGSAGPASAASGSIGPWANQGSNNVNTLGQGQGLTTVTRPDGSSYLWYTGDSAIPSGTRSAGWDHIGDPDSANGYVVEPYQTSGGGRKMFRVWTPDPNHTAHDFVHTLASGEAFNNSFAAVSPGGQWLVSGEYGTMNRFLVFPTPMINPAAPGSNANLPIASQIRLNHAVRDVQGCTFVTAIQLLCSSDDPDGSLFGTTKPLLRVNLSAPLGSSDVTGYVVSLGQIPMSSSCSGTFEAEGLDYDRAGGDLRIEVVQPSVCAVYTTLWRFRYSTPTGRIASAISSAKCLDEFGSSGANGTKVDLYDCNGSGAQSWAIAADGTIRIGGACLDIAGGATANGAAVEMWNCHGGGNQVWAPQADGSLLNPASGRCLDVPAFTTTNGTQLDIWDCNGGLNQRWTLP